MIGLLQTVPVPGTAYVYTVGQCFRCSKWHCIILDPKSMRLLSESPPYDAEADAWAAGREMAALNARYQPRMTRGGSA